MDLQKIRLCLRYFLKVGLFVEAVFFFWSRCPKTLISEGDKPRNIIEFM